MHCYKCHGKGHYVINTWYTSDRKKVETKVQCHMCKNESGFTTVEQHQELKSGGACESDLNIFITLYPYN